MYKKIALVNGRIHTPLGIREALSIEGGRIAELGTNAGIAPRAETAVDADTKIFDLGGRSVFPGFGDSHMHFMSWAESQELLDLRACRSIQELRASLRTHIETHPASEGEWYRGRGWNDANMEDGRVPDRRDLDDLS
ncbi:MAG: amidohydrolase family protein, partial [Synergistaceae bacterium]|nr:amidohydrolase family protein [Synergistaceae bacterium]